MVKKYNQIANVVRKRIIDAYYMIGQKLPSEKELGLEFKASKLTIKNALDILVAEGLIVKRRGAGTFVKSLSVDEIERLIIDNQMRGTTAFYPDKKVTSKILDFSVVEASEQVRQKLMISKGAFVYHIHRVRLVDEEPMVVEETYMPIDVIVGLRHEDLEGSIYHCIEERLELKIQSGHRKITVRKASEVETEELRLEKGDPVAVAEQIGYLNTGLPFEYSQSVHRYDLFSVEMMVTHS